MTVSHAVTRTQARLTERTKIFLNHDANSCNDGRPEMASARTTTWGAWQARGVPTRKTFLNGLLYFSFSALALRQETIRE